MQRIEEDRPEKEEKENEETLSERQIIIKALRDAGWYGSLGLFIGICLVFGLLFGMKLDDWFETDPIFTLVGVGFGLAAGARGVYRAIKKLL